MRTNLDRQTAFQFDAPFVSDADLIGYAHPRDIVTDPVLTLERKRQLLAYWASDIHAVAGTPALRTYAFGPAVSIDDLQAALEELDRMVDLPAIVSERSTATSA